LVQVGVLRRHEVDDTAVLVEDALGEQLELREVILTRIAATRRIREDRHVGLDFLEALQIEPVEDEVARERLGARVFQHARDLLAQHLLVGKLAAHGEVAQLVVRDRVPEEERQLRSERDVVDLVDVARRDAGRRSFDAIEEIRARENAGEPAADTFLEAIRSDAVAVVREQILEILFGDRPTVRARRELAQDALRAELLVVAARRMADENLVAARRIRQTRRIVWAAHLERLHAEHAILTAARHERLELVVGLGERSALERDAHLVGARRRREANVLQARVDLLHDAVLHLVVSARVLFAAERRLVDGLSVQGHDDGVLELRVVAPDVAEHVGDVDLVLAVRREQVRDDEAAARAERQALHVRLLAARRREVRLAAGARIGPADGADRDLPRGADVLLHERRRHLEAGRDVVEVLDLFVLRQELDGVDLEREQVADRVAVFLAIQTVRHDRLIAVVRDRGLVERVLKPYDERLEPLLVGTRLFRRRHRVAAQLAHGHLELLGMLRDALGLDLLEVEAAGEIGGVVAIGAIALDERPLLRGAVRDGRLAERVASGEHGRSRKRGG